MYLPSTTRGDLISTTRKLLLAAALLWPLGLFAPSCSDDAVDRGADATRDVTSDPADVASADVDPDADAGEVAADLVDEEMQAYFAALSDEIESFVTPFLEQGWLSALSVGVIRDGQTLELQFGVIDAEDPRPPDANTVYLVRSLSKTFTCLALADAVLEEGLELETPVREILPERVVVPSRAGREITLEHLATHTSGLPHSPDNGPHFAADCDLDGNYSVDLLYEFVSNTSLLTTPGFAYGYSNVGVALLGHAIAHYRGVEFDELIQTTILDELGLSSTFVGPPGEDELSRLAPGHDGDSGLFPFSAYCKNPGMTPAEGIRTTLRDMLIYLRAHLEPETTDLGSAMSLATYPRRPANTDNEIGLCWHRYEVADVIYHDGIGLGYAADLIFDQDARVGVVVLSNTESSVVRMIALAATQAARGDEYEPPAPQPTIDVDEDVLARYVGMYCAILEVSLVDGRLEASGWGVEDPNPSILYPVSETEFYERVGHNWAFDLVDGDVRGAHLTVGGDAFYCPKGS